MSIPMFPGINYIHKDDHRDNTPVKSQWKISKVEERNTFSFMYNSKWFNGNEGWGLHLQNDRFCYLGVGVNRDEKLFFAKFVDGNSNGNWHGYPGDLRKNQDIPDEDVLHDWGSKEYVRYSKIRKVLKGQRCKI